MKIDGTRILLTGATGGIGRLTAEALAGKGARLALVGRNPDALEPLCDRILLEGGDAHPVIADISTAAGAEAAAADAARHLGGIDLLINNAGVMYTPRQQTADGFEMQFGTNHLGHFAWTGQLLDRLTSVQGSRIVTVSSIGHRLRSRIDFDDLQAEKGYNRVSAYGRSKLANLFFTYELQRRLAAAGAETAALAAHPGGSDTELGRHIPGANLLRPVLSMMTQSAAMGALPTLRAATDPTATGGEYYGPDGFGETRGHPVVVKSSSRSHEVETQQRLWAASEELTGIRYPV